MLRDDEIKLGLRNAGIPYSAIATTLVKENAPELRELIVNRTLTTRGLFMYPLARVSSSRCRTLFYLVAKELFLSGISVYCIPLSRMHDAILAHEYEGDALMIDKSRHIFILDFCEDGAPFPLTPEQSARLRTWVRSKVEKEGGQVSVLSDHSVDRCTGWWPQSFVGFLTDNCIVQGAS